jgi:F-type H+-transporting ATPase subunit delta
MPAFVARYAEAFADVVTDVKLDTSATDRQFSDFLSTWQGSAELRTFFVNPAIPAPQKIAILDQLSGMIGMQKELRNLLAMLSILQRQLGIRPAEIVTARELSGDEQSALVAELAKLAGAKIDPSFKLDSSILGGAVVRIGSTVYDGSVRGRLDRLKEALTAD